MASKLPLSLDLLFLLQAFTLVYSESNIGVNYGILADNLPSPQETVKLLKSTLIGKLRLYYPDPTIVELLANSDIEIVLGIPNGDLPKMSSDPNFSKTWAEANIVPYMARSKISIVVVGNGVLSTRNSVLIGGLVHAMNNLRTALDALNLPNSKIKITTAHSMLVMGKSDPPSAGQFHPDFVDTLKSLLAFIYSEGAPFAIEPSPYFAYRSDPTPDNLVYCLFQPNAGRIDQNNKLKYTNMFDAQLDAVRSALDAADFKTVNIMVAETGWPYKGDADEAGATLDNSRTYHTNLLKHLRSKVGTPLMPGKSVNTFLFTLYDENLKSGPSSERSFGLFKPDQSPIIDVGLLKSNQNRATQPQAPAAGNGKWCVAREGIPDSKLQANLDYICGHGIDCAPIQPGGSCFEPNTVASRAAYAMNLYYQHSSRNELSCDFSQTGTITNVNPSYKSCIYPGA